MQHLSYPLSAKRKVRAQIFAEEHGCIVKLGGGSVVASSMFTLVAPDTRSRILQYPVSMYTKVSSYIERREAARKPSTTQRMIHCISVLQVVFLLVIPDIA